MRFDQLIASSICRQDQRPCPTTLVVALSLPDSSVSGQMCCQCRRFGLDISVERENRAFVTIFSANSQSLLDTRTIMHVAVIPVCCDVDAPLGLSMEFSRPMHCLIKNRYLSLIVCLAMIVGAFAMTGCQVSVGGQTLPSGYFLRDDIQYFPKGPEFKLSREAAALKEARAENSLNR